MKNFLNSLSMFNFQPSNFKFKKLFKKYSIVFWVSPGKPMMKSEDILIPGRIFFNFLIFDLYSNDVISQSRKDSE